MALRVTRLRFGIGVLFAIFAKKALDFCRIILYDLSDNNKPLKTPYIIIRRKIDMNTKAVRSISIIVAVLLIFAGISGTISAGGLPFVDVPGGEWYYDDLMTAYSLGLINGKSADTFAPNAYLLYAEAIKLAACMHQSHAEGAVSLANGSPWYQSYVDYAKEKNIIKKDYDWNKQATRAGYMEIFASALPTEALQAINDVADDAIPDVPMSHPSSSAIYKLYRAGIVNGVDAARNCSPESNIIRCQVAAILTRMMDSTKRKEFTLKNADTPDTPVVTLVTPQTVTAEEGDDVTFKVAATVGDGGKLTYMWEFYDGWEWKDITGIIGATGSGELTDTLVMNFSFKITQALLRCTVTNTKGEKTAKKSSPEINVTVISEEEDKTPPETPKVTLETPAAVSLKTDEPSIFAVSATVTDGGVLSYQWQCKQLDYGTWLDLTEDDAQTPMCTMSFPTMPGAKYEIRCNVTNTKNGETASVFSPIISVTMVAGAPTVSATPQTPTITRNSAESLDVFTTRDSFLVAVQARVTDGGVLTYQWEYRDATANGSWRNVEGSSGSKNSLRSTISGSAGTVYEFRCKVTNTKDGKTAETYSTVFTVTFKARPKLPEITQLSPASVDVPANESTSVRHTIKAVVSDGGALSYQWEYRNAAVDSSWRNVDVSNSSGTTDSLYVSINKESAGTVYEYLCKVTNTKDGATSVDYSPIFTVNVKAYTPQAPTITLDSPATVDIYLNNNSYTLKIKASVTDGGVLSYRWEFRNATKNESWINSTVSGNTSNSITATMSEPVGTKYEYRCKVTNTKNSVKTEAYSSVFAVIMKPQIPKVTIESGTTFNITAQKPDPFTLKISASVTDGGTLTYVWQVRNSSSDSWGEMGSNITSTATTSQLYSGGLSSGKYEFRCKVTNTKNGVSSVGYSGSFYVTSKYADEW